MKKKVKITQEPEETLGKMSKKDRNKLINASNKATFEMAKYLRENKLDPNKDWKNDPIHGEKIRAWAKIIHRAERKLTYLTSFNESKKQLVKPQVHPKTQTVKKAPNIYDYPDVDGKPMPRGMRKKYRSRMRALLKGNMTREEAEKRALELALTWIPEEDPTEQRKTKVSDPEFEINTLSKSSHKPTTEGGDTPKPKTKKEKRSREYRKAMAEKMKMRRGIKVKEEDELF